MINVAINVLILTTATLGVCLSMKREGLRSKLNYIVPFVVLGLATLTLTELRSYRTQSRSRTVLEGLGSLISDGRQLQLRCADESSPPPQQEVNRWKSKAETFLRVHLGDMYVSRFRNPAGVPTIATTIQSNPHAKLWFTIYLRLAKLDEFFKENVK